jgi:hypothetical protein
VHAVFLQRAYIYTLKLTHRSQTRYSLSVWIAPQPQHRRLVRAQVRISGAYVAPVLGLPGRSRAARQLLRVHALDAPHTSVPCALARRRAVPTARAPLDATCTPRQMARANSPRGLVQSLSTPRLTDVFWTGAKLLVPGPQWRTHVSSRDTATPLDARASSGSAGGRLCSCTWYVCTTVKNRSPSRAA